MKNYLLLLPVALLLNSCINQPTIEKDGGIIITASFKNYNKLVKEDINTIKERIEASGLIIQKFDTDSVRNKIIVTIPKINDTITIKGLFTIPGKVSIYETYDCGEILPCLIGINNELAQFKKDSLKKAPKTKLKNDVTLLDKIKQTQQRQDSSKSEINNPLFSILTPSAGRNGQPFPGAVLGYAKEEDTSKIMNYLNSHRTLLPKDVNILWSYKPLHNQNEIGVFELFAIRLNHRDFEDFEQNIIKSHAEAGRSASNYEIMIQLNAYGTKKFAQMTKVNIGRCLAAIMDKKVIFAPKVQNQIEKGNMVITGNFNELESRSLSGIFSKNTISGSFQNINIRVVTPNKQ